VDPSFRMRQERLRVEQEELLSHLTSTTSCRAGIKTSNFQWIPLYYHVLLLPNFNINNDVNANDLEMKINLDVQIYCNLTTNILQLRSWEFTNINLT
jgi:hypothetical protein